jgi:hypothetical protein
LCFGRIETGPDGFHRDADFAHGPLDSATTGDSEGGFRDFARVEDDVAFLKVEFLDHALTQFVARGLLVHTDIGLAAIAAGAFEVVIVEANDDDALVDRRANGFVKSIR